MSGPSTVRTCSLCTEVSRLPRPVLSEAGVETDGVGRCVTLKCEGESREERCAEDLGRHFRVGILS